MEYRDLRIDHQRAPVGCSKPGLWLLTLHTGMASVVSGNWYPQAYAVTDDFGDLVVVSAWR